MFFISRTNPLSGIQYYSTIPHTLPCYCYHSLSYHSIGLAGPILDPCHYSGKLSTNVPLPMWHPNHGDRLSRFTRWASYTSIRWLSTLFIDLRLAGSWYRRCCRGTSAEVPTILWRGGFGGWTGTETTWEDIRRERKRKSDRVFERRMSASLIYRRLRKREENEKTGELWGSTAAEQVCKTLLADWSYFCSSFPLACLTPLFYLQTKP